MFMVWVTSGLRLQVKALAIPQWSHNGNAGRSYKKRAAHLRRLHLHQPHLRGNHDYAANLILTPSS